MSSRSQYPLLMSPFELRGRMLRNRIVSTPHTTGWSDYNVRKAAGGPGLVMSNSCASSAKMAATVSPGERSDSRGAEYVAALAP
jgi:dimethylglycine catabolism A